MKTFSMHRNVFLVAFNLPSNLEIRVYLKFISDEEQTPLRESPIRVKYENLPMILLSNREPIGVFPPFNSSLGNELFLTAKKVSKGL